MKTSNLLMALMAAAGLTLAGAAQAANAPSRDAMATKPASTMTKDVRDQAYKDASAKYKADKDACKAMTGNAKDVCIEEAKGREKMAKADADAAYKGTPRAREHARIVHADAAYNVAKEKCDDLSGNQKDVCVKEAKAAHVKAKADAKVDRVAADTGTRSGEKTAAARKDAAEDKRDADYKVAIEKCDALSGAAKDNCVRDAKTRYGKS
jgi:hypothetical protein